MKDYNGIITMIINKKVQVIHFTGNLKMLINKLAPETYDGWVWKINSIYWDKPLNNKDAIIMTEHQIEEIKKPPYWDKEKL